MASLETRSGQEDNKAPYNQRNGDREQLIANLLALQIEEDTSKITAKLEELGFGMEEGFADKSAGEMQASLGEVIAHLQEYSSEVIKVTATVKEDVIETTKNKGVDALTTTLEKVTEGRYLSVEAMNEALKKLTGVRVEIPATEIKRLKQLRPTKISEADMAKMEAMKAQSEGEKGLMVMQLPTKIMVDGEEKPFTIATMEAVMEKAANADLSLKRVSISEYITDEVKNKTWFSDLQAWTSACLKGSKNKKYKDQLAYQVEVLGEGNKIEADMFLAMLLLYIASKEELMLQDYMRLNTWDSDGDSLVAYFDRNDVNLISSSSPAISNGGIGASLCIST